MSSFSPLIAIVGTTGVSKSRLAIELARYCASRGTTAPWLDAKVINGDAMQVYKRLDVITNKLPVDEQENVEHLLMGIREPHEQYIVSDWLSDATSTISQMHKDHKVPIVVGGTAYWIQNLIFGSRLASVSSLDTRVSLPTMPVKPVTLSLSSNLQRSLESLPPELQQLWASMPQVAPRSRTHPEEAYALYSLLAGLDPATAARWHWKDSRHVLTSLKIIRQHGTKASDYLIQQSKSEFTRY